MLTAFDLASMWSSCDSKRAFNLKIIFVNIIYLQNDPIYEQFSKWQCGKDQPLPRPLEMDGGILRTGTRNKLTRGQQDSCHLTILDVSDSDSLSSVAEVYKGETSH